MDWKIGFIYFLKGKIILVKVVFRDDNYKLENYVFLFYFINIKWGVCYVYWSKLLFW